MILTSIPPMSSWEGEVSTTLDSAPIIGSHPFDIIHLNPPPGLPLEAKYSIDCLPQEPNKNFPIDINFDVNPVLVQPNKFSEVLLVFSYTTTYNP